MDGRKTIYGRAPHRHEYGEKEMKDYFLQEEAVTKIQVAAIVVIIIVALIAGVAYYGTQRPSQQKIGLLGYAWSNVWVFWDPSETFSSEITVLNSVYEPLLWYDYESKAPKPCLATSWEASPDAMHWTFHLREGVKFHCGHKFNATAVKYSIERNMKLHKGSSYIWDPVDNIEILDEYTVRFNLKYPAPLDLIATTGYCSQPYCPICTEEHGHDWFYEGHDLGTGPYYVEKYDKAKEILYLRKFDDYWGGWTGKEFEQIIVYAIPEPSTAKMMLEKGELMIDNYLPSDMIEDLKKNPKIKIVTTPSWQNMLGLLNTQEPSPLHNKLLRQALSYAVPYEDAIKYVRGGYAIQSYGCIPVGILGHSDTLPQYNYNLTKASELLAQAGYPNGTGLRPLILIHEAGDDEQRKFAELYKAELAKIGVTLDIREMEWTAEMAMIAGPPEQRQDIFLFYWWPDYADPYSWLGSMFHSVAPEDIVFEAAYYNNSNFDHLIDEARKISATDKVKAQEMYEEAQRLLIDDAVALFIYDWTYVRPLRVELKGYVDNPAYSNAWNLHDMYWEEG
jgi:peptide/nickel transport system substrate-binding protein